MHPKGFVKFDRKIKEWGWYTDVKTFKLFFHLIISANFVDGYFLGVPIKRGQLPKSIEHLAAETGLTCSEVRTAIKHLESTGEITTKSQTKFTVFTIVNYSIYQAKDKSFSNDLANDLATKSQTFDEHLTNESQQYKNDKNDKNKKNDKNIYIPPLSPTGETKHTPEKESFGEFQNVRLTQKEYEKLKSDFSDKADKAIKFLDEYIEEKGYKSKSHNLAIRRWVIDAVDEHSKKEANSKSIKQAFGFDFSLDDIFEKP